MIEHQTTDNEESRAAHGQAKLDWPGRLAPLAISLRGAPYRRTRWFFCAAVACQLAVPTGLASVKGYTLLCGRTVCLRTTPIDPRDPMRGEYLCLNYEVSNVPARQHLPEGRRVFVVLRQGEPYWTAERVVDRLPRLSPSEVALKGRIESRWNQKPGTVHVHYGIEQAFVEEGRGQPLEKEKHFRVYVAVDRSGEAVVKEIRPE